MESLLIPPAYRTSPLPCPSDLSITRVTGFFLSFPSEFGHYLKKNKKAKTPVLWLSPHLTLTERLTLGTDRENDLGDEPASRFRESIAVLSCKTTRISSSLQSSCMYMHNYRSLIISACLLVHLALNHDKQLMRLYGKPHILLQSRHLQLHLQLVSSFCTVADSTAQPGGVGIVSSCRIIHVNVAESVLDTCMFTYLQQPFLHCNHLLFKVVPCFCNLLQMDRFARGLTGCNWMWNPRCLSIPARALAAA